MTERLYYNDSALTKFEARVVACDEQAATLYLDRTAFYPTSGGQSHDRGTLNGIAVVDVIDEEDRIAHVLASPLHASSVEGVIDWARRFDHMQQHTGQHLLSAVLAERFGISTISFHLGDEASTIDIDQDPGDRLAAIEREVNREVHANRPVSVSVEDSPAGLRKASDRTGPLRVVSIAGIDRSACGGTHVASTGQIGFVSLRKVEKIRQSWRVEFLCGERAVARTRADFDALSAAARAFSVALDQVPGSVSSTQSRLAVAEKALAKLRLAAAEQRGLDLYNEVTGPGRSTFVATVEEISDEVRAEAQGFTSSGDAIYMAIAGPAVLLAVSAGSGLNAGALFKAAIGQVGGRGGGGKTLAQGTSDNAKAVVELIQAQL